MDCLHDIRPGDVVRFEQRLYYLGNYFRLFGACFTGWQTCSEAVFKECFTVTGEDDGRTEQVQPGDVA